MKLYKWTLLLASYLVLSGACSSESNEPDTDETTISISAPSVSNVTDDKATVVATITTNTPSAILKKGICYDTQSNPTISNRTVEMSSAGLSLNLTLSELDPETKYYARAFATIANGNPVYSSEIIHYSIPQCYF